MTKQKKSTRLFYTDEAHLKMYESMPAEDFKELFTQALSYRYGDEAEPEFSNPMTTAVWMMLKKEIDFNEEKWKKKAETSRENGKKGGRPSKQNDIENEEEYSPTSFSEYEDFMMNANY